MELLSVILSGNCTSVILRFQDSWGVNSYCFQGTIRMK